MPLRWQEIGIRAIALHPGFDPTNASTRWVYIFYTPKTHAIQETVSAGGSNKPARSPIECTSVMRLIRVAAKVNGSSQIAEDTTVARTVLVDVPMPTGHAGGTISVQSDSSVSGGVSLIVTTGDGAAAATVDAGVGSLLRLRP